MVEKVGSKGNSLEESQQHTSQCLDERDTALRRTRCTFKVMPEVIEGCQVVVIIVGNVSGHILGSYYAKFWGPNIMPRRANRTQFGCEIDWFCISRHRYR